jgi:hypothetical protein
MAQSLTLSEFNRSYGSFEQLLQKRLVMEKTCFEDIVFPNNNTVYKVAGILTPLLRRLHSEFGSLPQAFHHILGDDECVYESTQPGDGSTYHYCWVYNIKSTKQFSNMLKDLEAFNHLVNLYHRLVECLCSDSERCVCSQFLLQGTIFIHWFLTTPNVYFVDNVYSTQGLRKEGKEKRTRRWYCILIPKKPEIVVFNHVEKEISSLEDFLWRFSQEHPQIEYCTRKSVRRSDFEDKIRSLHLTDKATLKYVSKHIRLMELLQQKKQQTSVQSTSQQASENDETIEMDLNHGPPEPLIQRVEIPDSWDDVPDSWEDL